MKRKLTALLLTLALCVGLSVPALAAEEQKIVVNGQTYEKVLQTLLSCTEDEPVTLRLESDIQLTAAVILGASDYDGLFGGEVITVIPHDITIDLNGYTLTGEAGVAVFEVQEGYTLTIADTSEGKTGKLVSQGEEAVTVAQGGTYIPLSAPEEEQKIVVNDGEVYAHVLRALLSCTEDAPVTLRLESDIQLTATVILGASDYDGLFGGAVITVIPHDITIDLNGYTLTGEEGLVVFEVQEGYTLTIADTSADKTGKLVTQGEEAVTVAQGGVYNPLKEPEQPDEEVHTGGGVSKPAINPNAGKNKEKVTFTDVAEDAWYVDAVSWAVEQGITSGTSETTFSPDASCTRAQTVTFLSRV